MSVIPGYYSKPINCKKCNMLNVVLIDHDKDYVNKFFKCSKCGTEHKVTVRTFVKEWKEG